MSGNGHSDARKIRSRLNHPIIDADGHWLEFGVRFCFGCEADDPINAWAFDRRANPFGARLNTLFGSDLGHFDVPDMADVVPEAYELVEDGLITADDFRDFTFANSVRFWGTVHLGMFKGTVVEGAAATVLAEAPAAP